MEKDRKKTLTISSSLKKKIDTSVISSDGKKSFAVEKKKPFKPNKNFSKNNHISKPSLNPNTKKKIQDIQSKKLQRAGAVIAVLSTPVEHPSIPEWEMHLSSGAVCMNLLSCAQSLGYAAQWLTEWYAYNEKMLEYLGGRPNIDKISGFIYICLLYTSPSPRDQRGSRMPSSA